MVETKTAAADALLQQLAARLRDAQRTRHPVPRLTGMTSLTPEDAYHLQAINIEHRLDHGLYGRPTRIVGRKVGLTSKAIQQWLNVEQPDYGTLLDDMCVEDGGEVPMKHLLQPRAEGELAFVLGRDIQGPGVTGLDVVAATAFVLPSIEVIDSRIENWNITFEDTVADNASSGMFAVGTRPILLTAIDMRLVGMTLRKNGRVVSTGAGVASMGNPVAAVAWLINTLGYMGEGLAAGEVVLSGALGPVTDVAAGDRVEVSIGNVGSVRVSFGAGD